MAYPRGAARAPRRDLVRAWRIQGADMLLAVAIMLLGAVLLAHVGGDFNVDSWLALVTGRAVWQSGVPHVETLTAMSRGQAWIDQQWLSQLIDYAVYRLGGLGLLAVVNVALLVGPVAAATVAARRLGAPFRSVLLMLPVCLAAITPSREVRTQELAIPLFVALVLLLATDSRRPSRRVLWCLPILALWANLHGTVTLGALLVVLRGALLVWERRSAALRSVRAWARPLALVLGAPLACLITPYGLSILGYYRTTMLSSTLRQFVVEWKPVTVVPSTAAAVFVLAGVALWSFGRSPRRTTLWEKLALLALTAGSIDVVRNALFLGLLGLIVVPVALGCGPAGSPSAAAGGSDRRRSAINLTLALAAAGALLLTVVATLIRPGADIEYAAQRPALLAAVRSATTENPSLRVLADEHFSDWLLWRDPALSGRVANDVRFELLSARRLSALESVFAVQGRDWKAAARGYRLLVLDRATEPQSFAAFLAEPGRRVLYDDGQQLVILRSAGAARQG